jgi:hypothetical protein
MQNGLIGSQPCQCQRSDLCSNAHGFGLLPAVWELHGIFQRQALRDQMIIDQIEDSSWQQVCRNVKISGVACAQLQGINGESMRRHMGIRRGEDGRLGWGKRRCRCVVI